MQRYIQTHVVGREWASHRTRWVLAGPNLVYEAAWNAQGLGTKKCGI